MMFIDAQAQHEKSPETFSVHHIEDLKAVIEPGDYVKVCHANPGERFWVLVDEIDGDKLAGRVANNLIFTDLKFNQTIEFEYRHIYDYQPCGLPISDEEDEKDNIQYVHDTCN